jgi:integrase/recombinase XerD
MIFWEIVRKDVVDKNIITTKKLRSRLMLELMAHGGMRIGEVLKLRPMDVNDRKLTLRDPKSGKERECVFISQKVADRLKEYIRDNGIEPDQRIFSISYEAARTMVKKAGERIEIRLRPHDLRRHAAIPQGGTSRLGVPIEIVSKIILRHASLSTTQIYVGKVRDTEAVRRIENIYA